MSEQAGSLRDPFRLDGEVALVTGGGSGLGAVIAGRLAAAGARVAIVGRRQAELEQTAAGIGGMAFAADVTDLAGLPALLGRVERELGSVSLLVNNAGVHLKAAALQTSDEQFEHVMRTHVSAAYALSRACAAPMLDRGRGSVIFIGSMAAVMGVPLVSAYSAAKGAVIAAARALAAEWSPRGVRVNAVTPGWIDVGMARSVLEKDPARLAKVIGRTPMGAMGRPEDIAYAVVYLCSDAGRFVTGVNHIVDGGASIGF